MATVIADHYDSPWVQYGCYAIATTVGYARMYHDAHWLSDVFGGALVGTLTAREVVRFNRETRSERTGWVPRVGTDGQSLTLNWAY
jgi:membrane-associated phospholipid phosphatase